MNESQKKPSPFKVRAAADASAAPTPPAPPAEPAGPAEGVAPADVPVADVSWDELPLSDELLALVKKAGFEKPTPVQAASIAPVLEGLDLLVSAQTGTGKTAAFGLPMLDRMKGRGGTYALVLSPTREIALQTHTFMNEFGAPLGVRAAALIGGIDLKLDEAALRGYPQILVATPGRLCDHLERGNVWLEYLEMVVLDEADRMLDMGFSVQIDRILREIPVTRQTLLFSATFPPNVEKLAHKILYQPQRIKIGKPVSAAKTVDQRFIFTDEKNKLSQLLRLLSRERGTVIVFARSKDAAARLWRSLRNRGFDDATQIHSDLEQSFREQALEDFKSGRYRVLIATDVVGRGIHVDGVAHVVNYDLPREASDYVHRIGRTGRAQMEGKATTFVTPRDEPGLRKIEKMLGRSVRPSDSR